MDKKKVVLVWFRNDLRLHDNEVLYEAAKKADVVIPVYCFDPRYFQSNKYGNKNTGALRAQFIIETVEELKRNLNLLDSDLMTYMGLPEEIIPRLVSKYEVDEVYHHREVAHRETSISENVESAIWQENKINLKHFIGHTLYHKEDLPFPIKDIPDSFGIFKKKVERESVVRNTIEDIQSIITPTHLEHTTIPSLSELGYTTEEIANVATKQLIGGENNGLEHLNKLIQSDYNGFHDFTLISPYIATGALSPVLIYHRLLNAISSQAKKKYDNRMSRLLWRDYFRFMLKKYPNVYFKETGLKGEITKSDGSKNKTIADWKDAKTGESFIDEAIQTLRQTGNLPYAARNIIGQYLLQETTHSWLEGASFFEEHLLDYTPSTIYGYWSHVASVGTSAKDNLKSSWRDSIIKKYPNGLQYHIETEVV